MSPRSTSPMKAVVFWEPTINLAHPDCDLSAYCDDRDIRSLQFHPPSRPDDDGNPVGKPQIFHIRPLPSRVVMTQIMAENSMQVRRLKAFYLCVSQVDDPRFVDYPVFTPQAVRESTDDDGTIGALRLWSNAELDMVDATTIGEIGEVALGFNTLPKDARGGFVLPPMSRRLLIGMKRLYVAMAAKASRHDSAEQGPGSSPTTSGEQSATHGDATVTGDEESEGATVAQRLAVSKAVDSP